MILIKPTVLLFALFCTPKLQQFEDITNKEAISTLQNHPLNISIATNQEKKMKLTDLKQYFAMSYSEFISLNHIHSNQVEENRRYEKLTNVTRIGLPTGHNFYFKDEKLLLIYISEEELVKELWNEFKNTVDIKSPERIVRSRAGKTANQLVFSNQGISASVTKDEVHFIEIYPPCSVDYYLSNMYEEPGAFIR